MNRRDKLILFAMSHAAAKNSEQCNAAVDAIERQLDSAQAQAPGHQQAQGETCAWTETEYEWGTGYATSCGERVQSLIDIEGMRFCPYCGRKLSPVR